MHPKTLGLSRLWDTVNYTAMNEDVSNLSLSAGFHAFLGQVMAVPFGCRKLRGPLIFKRVTRQGLVRTKLIAFLYVWDVSPTRAGSTGWHPKGSQFPFCSKQVAGSAPPLLFVFSPQQGFSFL